MEEADLFDAAHFRLSLAEAAAMDPQTRLLLQVILSSAPHSSFEGLSPLDGSRVCALVYVAHHTMTAVT